MENEKNFVLSAEEKDAIGEIMNISMGSAATAVSTMLEKQVTITTPNMEVGEISQFDCSDLEPAILVKIEYIEGIEGSNIIMLKRHDMKIILNLLMGNEYEANDDDFEFDDMSMSAACEVMNQMMGASSTALSEILGMPINISTPESNLVESGEETNNYFDSLNIKDSVVSISFKMMIKDVLDTTFRCFMMHSFAKKIIDLINPPKETAPELSDVTPQMNNFTPFTTNERAQANIHAEPTINEEHMSQPQQQPVLQNTMPQPQQQPVPPNIMPQPQVQPLPQNTVPQPQQNNPQQDLQYYAGQQPIQGQQYYGQPYPMSQPQPAAPQYGVQHTLDFGGQNAQIPIKYAEFPDFKQPQTAEQGPYGLNMGLLMGVQLEVSVIVGRTKRKIKDIMDFGQGSVVMLDTQTGAPAEIVVNGQLIAYGDVVVVGDNFGIRITEIVGTKELMESLRPQG